MPFGIRSAPEVFQRKMHELIEGLSGVEVIADDSVVVGYGELWQSAILRTMTGIFYRFFRDVMSAEFI